MYLESCHDLVDSQFLVLVNNMSCNTRLDHDRFCSVAKTINADRGAQRVSFITQHFLVVNEDH